MLNPDIVRRLNAAQLRKLADAYGDLNKAFEILETRCRDAGDRDQERDARNKASMYLGEAARYEEMANIEAEGEAPSRGEKSQD